MQILASDNVIRKVFRHAIEQPFVFTVGLAALIHSTWTLGTLFAGNAPVITDAYSALAWLAWVIPALLIAFALDVGQIVTSAEIRESGFNLFKYITFFVFAAGTYYLQWLYMAHHMPALELSAGVTANRAFALGLRDAAVWVVPALLPISTLLYTFSHKVQIQAASNAPVVAIEKQTVEAPRIKTATQEALPAHVENAESMHKAEYKKRSVTFVGNATDEVKDLIEQAERIGKDYVVHCPRCNQEIRQDNLKSLRMSVTAHLGRWCKVPKASLNGMAKVVHE